MKRTRDVSEVLPYTYTVTRICDGLQYHGVRYKNIKTGTPPINDLGKKYFTSGIFKKEFKSNPNSFLTKIRWTFSSVEDACLWESLVNRRLIRRNNWANIAVGKSFSNVDKLKIRREEACMKKYGVRHNMMVKEIRDKRDETLTAIYGTTNSSSTNIIKNKVKQTCIDKFGVEFAYQADSVKNNIKKSMLKKYGVDNPLKCEKIVNEMKIRSKEKYGCEYNTQRKDVIQKIHSKRKEMYIKLGQMTKKEFDIYLSNISQNKAVQNQKKSQREIGMKLLNKTYV